MQGVSGGSVDKRPLPSVSSRLLQSHQLRMSEETISKCDNLNIWKIVSSPHNILKLCTAFFILLANTILITLILKSKKLREQRFHKFILSLATADILVGLAIPFMVLTAKEDSWGLGVHCCKVDNWVGTPSLEKFGQGEERPG